MYDPLYIVLIGFIMLISLPACAGTPAPQATPTPQLTAADIVKQTSEKIKGVNTVRMFLDVEGGTMNVAGQNIRSMTGDLVKPDKTKVNAKVVVGNMIGEIDIITIGNEQWITNPLTKRWQKLPNVASFSPLDPNTGIANLLVNAKDLKKQSDTTIDGTPVYHITGTINGKDLTALMGGVSADKQIPAEIWIAKSDMLPRQIKVTGTILPTESETIVRTIKLTDYNAQITIDPPQ